MLKARLTRLTPQDTLRVLVITTSLRPSGLDNPYHDPLVLAWKPPMMDLVVRAYGVYFRIPSTLPHERFYKAPPIRLFNGHIVE